MKFQCKEEKINNFSSGKLNAYQPMLVDDEK